MRKKKINSLTLLGKPVSELPKSPGKAKLEVFKNNFPKRNYEISIDCPDFTSLCPVTGQPDFAEIEIIYVPDKVCVETKSLKLYLGAFRNEPSFNEEIVNRILDDLIESVHPRSMSVIGRFASRGGISLTIKALHSNPSE
ncbi:MAG TPA: NADPH-dependent 7-cyano-7-deazaguanine reductase QueF [Verrucomicrobiales bacterium]|nr:NADPH-dependent 7-cyano-7-deazaguanine reductase QueF [Verrucomicrobiales bacterium]